MSGELVPVAAPTITLSDGRTFPADPEVRKEQARANMVTVRTGAVQSAKEAAKIAAFDAEQRAAGKQMTGEQATRHAHEVRTFHDRIAFAKALTPHLDKAGRVSSDIMNAAAPLLHGYKLPAGITVNAKSAYLMLEVARRAGFDQSIVDRFIKAEMELGLA